MSTTAALFTLLVAVAGALLIAALRRRQAKRWSDITIPMPQVLREGLHFVYYLSLPGQMQQTADHTSLFWHGQFYGLDQLEAELRGRPHGLVLDCGPQLLPHPGNGQKAMLSPTAAADLRTLFTEMRQRGLLERAKYLAPMDEPNLFCASQSDLAQAVATMKAVAAEFPELDGVRYLCIYGWDCKALWCLEEFDVVGVDNYEQRSEVLTRGAHADLMRALLPHQQAMVLPGAAYGQDPQAFIAYAHSEPRVWGVVPFIWCHVPASADKEGWRGLELQGEEAQQRYRQAGMAVLNRQRAA